MARRFPAIDIDVQSQALAGLVQSRAAAAFGEAPVRHSREPRRLLMYRCDEPFARMALSATLNGLSHLIEVLAGERQYLIAGTHPSGKPYTWEDDLPAPEDLPLLTRESALAFLQDLAQFLREKGLEVKLIGDGELREVHAPPQEELEAPSIGVLRSLVSRLPNNHKVAATWEDWIQVGHAIKAAAGGDGSGLDMFLEWTARCERVDPADPEEAESQYGRMRAPHRVGWRWLQELADAHAPNYSSAQDDFDGMTVEGAQPPREQDSPPADLTDEGIVDWLLPRLRDRLRYSPAAKKWYVWHGHKWEADGIMRHERVLRRQLSDMCDLLRDRAASAPGKEGAPLYKASKDYRSAARIEAVNKLLRAPLACRPSDFDVDPWLLNTPAGVVDLRTGDTASALPSQMHARSTAVAPQKGAAPLWRQFLVDTTGGDAELIRFLQRMLGYSLTGDMSEKALWYAWGSESDTGKSTLIRTIMQLWGDYADTISPDVFMRSRADRIPAELARMPGVRLVTATEPEAGKVWDEQRVKSITGGDPIEVRFLYGQPFTYQPAFKILIVGNEEPELRHIDSAMLRRIRIVPVNVPVPREKQIPNLSERMVAEEGPAILAWLIEGCRAWQADGLGASEAVTTTTTGYAVDEDLMAQWVREECEIVEDGEATRHELYQAWAGWCRGRGEDGGGLKAFRRRMRPAVRSYGLTDRQVGDRRLAGYRGIRLRTETVDGTEFDT